MAGTVWSKWFWSDWDTDPALRLCGLAAQGLWMRCLCIAAAHDPIGFVAVAGRPLDSAALARMVGGTEPEVAALLDELERNGVFSRDAKRRIYSRRMIRDAKKTAVARKNGKKGGNPALTATNGKTTDKSGLLKGQDKTPLKGRDNTHKPESISHKPEREEESSPQPPSPEPAAAPPGGLNGEAVALSRDDLLGITRRLAKLGASPLDPSRPQAFTRELDLVKGWLADGIDVEATVVPAIARRLTNTAEETIGSLKFYDRDVRKAHAKRISANGDGGGKPPTTEQRRASLERNAKLYRQMGRDEEADEAERQLRALH